MHTLEENSYRTRPMRNTKKILKLSLLTLANSLTELVGFSIYIPLIMILLLKQNDPKRQVIDQIAHALGITNNVTIIITTGAILILISVIKTALQLKIIAEQNDKLYKMYSEATTIQFRSIMNQGLLYIKDNSRSTLANKVCITTYTYIFQYLKPLSILASNIITIVIIAIITALIYPIASLIVLIIIIPSLIIYYAIYKGPMSELGKLENSSRRNQMKIVHETLRGYTEMIVNNYMQIIYSNFNKELDNQINAKRESENRRELFSRSAEILILFMLIIVSAAMAIPAISKSSTPMMIAIIGAAIIKIVPAVKSALQNATTIKNAQYSLQITKTPSIKTETDKIKPAFENQISITNLTFTYPNTNQPTLENKNLLIQKGSTVGIKGASGIGKTTLINLLLNFHEPQQGRIEVDGVPLNKIDTLAWHQKIAYVSQETFIMDATIEENIIMNMPYDSIKLSKTIERLRIKNKEIAGEGGCKLSGGERQRVALARAIYKEAEIIILDEATSSLDKESEREILESLKIIKEQDKYLTIIIVTHRDAPLELCDKIFEI
ncbi:Vitamin B12 import ATP-binding protein BtuD [bioreactor metagenome]|uniref:Vitamin B12 import ATP-binding protein BtuD n=1 Tax=bioreactor metagenome TaxID=1076179 RepID=A0A645BF10_9ZZZZ